MVRCLAAGIAQALTNRDLTQEQLLTGVLSDVRLTKRRERGRITLGRSRMVIICRPLREYMIS